MEKMDAEASSLSMSILVLEKPKGLTFDMFVQDSWIGGRVIVFGTIDG